MSKFNKLNVLKILMVIPLAAFFVLLSMFAFLQAHESQSDLFSKYNVFASMPKQSLVDLQARQEILQKRLEFMVFDDERIKIQKQLLGVLTSQINVQPYDVQLWRDLVFTQSASNSSMQERTWSFQVWKKMHEWNRNEQVNFIDRCAFFVESGETKGVASACADFISRALKTRKVASLAHALQISVDELAELAAYYDVPFTVTPR